MQDFEEERASLECFIQNNWIYLKENSNAYTWKKKFLEKRILREKDTEDKKKLERAELAEWLLTKCLQNTKDLDDINTIRSVICQYKNDEMLPSKRKIEVAAQEDTRKDHDQSKTFLLENQKVIERNLKRSDAITIKDHLVQNLIIDLKENEQLVKEEKKFDYEKSSLTTRVMNIVIKNISSGTYPCLLQSLETINNKRCQPRLSKLIDGLKNKSMAAFLQSEASTTITENLKSTFYENDIEGRNTFLMTLKAENCNGQEDIGAYSSIAGDEESINRTFSKIASSCTNTSPGSLVIHFHMIERNMQNYLKECLRSGKVTAVVQMLFNEISIKDVIASDKLLLKVKIETSEESHFYEPLPENATEIMKFVPDNMSFLLEEMDTDAMEEGLEKIKINIPKPMPCRGRRDRANEIIEFILNNRFEENMMLVINNNQEERFDILLHRLETYKNVYMTEPSCLRKNLLLQFSRIVEDIDIEEIQDVLLERRTIEEHILKAIEDRFSNRRDIGMATLLLKILNSSDAVRAFVDALFIMNWPLAEKLIGLQSEMIVVEKESQVEICEISPEENLLFEGSFNVFIEKRVVSSSNPRNDLNIQGARHEFTSSRLEMEDARRYFVVGSVFVEIVTPLFQQKLEDSYQTLKFECLKDFLNNKAVIHILFHLRHRNAWCCKDKANCDNRAALPLNHHQWKQLYSENPGPGIHHCFCKYTAKSVKPEDLDLALCGLILYNCCNLEQCDEDAVHILRRNKNDFLRHNTTFCITKDEYGPLMDELKTTILQLDQTKEDELIRIQKRPLDDSLCSKYVTTLLGFHEVLEKIETKIDLTTVKILDAVEMKISQLDDKLEELLHVLQHVPIQSSIKTKYKRVNLRFMAPYKHVTKQEANSNRVNIEDKRRYFIVGSIYLEIVEPLFQQKLENIYKKINCGCLKDFLDCKPVIHTLYQIRHHDSLRCTDEANRTNIIPFTITCQQWEQLYVENTEPIKSNCYYNFTAKSTKLEELDFNLCGVILLNCCKLEKLDQVAVHVLRGYTKKYLSHNTTCEITAGEYDTLRNNLIQSVLQLDPNKEDELVMIQRRPLDDALCNKYTTTLLDIHETLEQIDTSIELRTAETLQTIDINVDQLNGKIEEVLQHLQCKSSYLTETRNEQGIKNQSTKPDISGSSVVPMHAKVDLRSSVGDETTNEATNNVIMDNRMFKICPAVMSRSMSFKENGFHLKIMNKKKMAWITAFKCKVFTEPNMLPSDFVETYDIKQKNELNNIAVPERMKWGDFLAFIKLFLHIHSENLIMDYQKKEKMQLRCCQSLNLPINCQEKEMSPFVTYCDLIMLCKELKIYLDLHKRRYRCRSTDDRQKPLMIITHHSHDFSCVSCEDKPVQIVLSSCEPYKTENKFVLQCLWTLLERKVTKLVPKDDY